MQRAAAREMRQAAYDVHDAACSMQQTTCKRQRATCSMHQTTRNPRLSACHGAAVAVQWRRARRLNCPPTSSAASLAFTFAALSSACLALSSVLAFDAALSAGSVFRALLSVRACLSSAFTCDVSPLRYCVGRILDCT
jgi:hypothetical protein